MNDRLSPESARLVLEALKNAGEEDLAQTLRDHLEGRARGEDARRLADLWLR